MDLYSRKIISWVLSDTLETKWIVEAVNKAKKARNISKPLIMHSDRGRQYTSKDYANATTGMTLSYSKKAYPWDNACIEAFYNTVRIHSHCKYTSPNDYERQYWITLRHLEISAA